MLHIFLMNINAGKYNTYEIGKIINEFCKSKNIMYSIEFTSNKNDTFKILEKYKNFDNVVMYSVGGDGTLNNVVNSIVGTNIKLNVIPLGTGNDFYRSLDNYKNNKIDLGKVNDKYFINVASLGIDAEIANTANELKEKKLKGNLVYPISIVKNFFPYKALSMNINNINKLITILTICNGKYYGNGFNIAPYASLDDGLFDVYEIEKINKIQTFKVLLELINTTHTNNNKVKFYRTNSIEIESDIDLLCNIDGEIIKGNKFDFTIEKEAITLGNDDLNIKGLLKSKRIIK